jgi:hypothetical protein
VKNSFLPTNGDRSAEKANSGTGSDGVVQHANAGKTEIQQKKIVTLLDEPTQMLMIRIIRHE